MAGQLLVFKWKMKNNKEQIISPIGYIQTDFKEKFGIPRQSMLVEGLFGRITFQPPYNDPAAFRGIEEFSHIWLFWGFSKSEYDGKTLTVHPPRLGGKEKRGVFATRSPFRPNGIGMSVVRLEEVINDPEAGIILVVSGVDMLDGTPIYDIKPYMPYSDSIPEAEGGFGQRHKDDKIEVVIPETELSKLPENMKITVRGLLEQDPRAAYNREPGFIYGMHFRNYDIRFTVDDSRIVVCEIIDTTNGFDKVK